MSAPSGLRKYWLTASEHELKLALRDAHASVSAFARATEVHGSLIQDWIAGQAVVEFEHYPTNDIVDVRHGSQFYYHSHRDQGKEHGHLHLFYHATASGKRRYFRSGKPRWNRTEPTHLFAISLDSRGLPVSLFTVNQWVTDGHWLDVPTTMACAERFLLKNVDGYEHSCRWLTSFVRLYRPLINDLLHRRDQRLLRRGDISKALQDRRLEVLSHTQIDWIRDMQALENLVDQRSRASSGVGSDLIPLPAA